MFLDVDRYRYTTKKKRKGGKWVIIPILLIIAVGILALTGTLPKIVGFVKNIGNRTSEQTLLLELWSKQSYDSLIETTERMLKRNPLDRYALIFKGFAYFYKAISEPSIERKTSYLQESIRSLRLARILKLGKLDGEVSYILGKAYFYMGRYYYDNCIKYINLSIREGFKASDQYEYLGLAYTQIGLLKRGIEEYKKALEIKQSDIILLSIAKNYLQLKNYKKAEEYLLRTINSTKDTLVERKSRLLLGNLYLKRGELVKAEKEYKKIISLDAKSADAHYYLGVVYEKMGKPIMARAEWRETLRINPNHYAARLKYYK